MSTYTHGHGDAVLRNHSWRDASNSAAYLLPRLQPGLSLLDVGCGPGTVTVDLAERVAPGEVLGLDTTDDVLDRARALGGPASLRFEIGDALDLGEPDRWDVVHAHQVLQHLENPVAALREMLRVAKPGGTVAVRDADYAAMSWWPLDPGLESWQHVYRCVARANGGEPDAGRRLRRWAREAGASAIAASSSVWFFSTPDERTWWAETWASRITDGPLARRAVGLGLATEDELAGIARAWHNWAADPDAVFSVVHTELLLTA